MIHRVELGGRPVRYFVEGDGEPLVLVHGLSGSRRWWRRNVAALAERHRVHVVDLPRPRRGGPSLPEAVLWLIAWMNAVELRGADLVGHSLGGHICLHVAAARPQLVRHLVLVAPTGLPTGRSLPGHVLPLLAAIRRGGAGLLPLLLTDAARTHPRTLLRLAHELVREDVTETLRHIEASTLLVWGENDPLVPPALAHAFRRQLPRSAVVVLDGAGHVPMLERPGAFNRAVLDFLDAEE